MYRISIIRNNVVVYTEITDDLTEIKERFCEEEIICEVLYVR